MSGGGSKPGERRGGRQKGTPNKANLGRVRAEELARAEAAKAPPPDRPEFDAKVQIEQFAMVLVNMVVAERAKPKPDVKFIRDLIESGVRACTALLPYQHRRLGQIGFDVEALLNKNDGTLRVSISSTEADF